MQASQISQTIKADKQASPSLGALGGWLAACGGKRAAGWPPRRLAPGGPAGWLAGRFVVKAANSIKKLIKLKETQTKVIHPT